MDVNHQLLTSSSLVAHLQIFEISLWYISLLRDRLIIHLGESGRLGYHFVNGIKVVVLRLSSKVRIGNNLKEIL